MYVLECLRTLRVERDVLVVIVKYRRRTKSRTRSEEKEVHLRNQHGCHGDRGKLFYWSVVTGLVGLHQMLEEVNVIDRWMAGMGIFIHGLVCCRERS